MLLFVVREDPLVAASLAVRAPSRARMSVPAFRRAPVALAGFDSRVVVAPLGFLVARFHQFSRITIHATCPDHSAAYPGIPRVRRIGDVRVFSHVEIAFSCLSFGP